MLLIHTNPGKISFPAARRRAVVAAALALALTLPALAPAAVANQPAAEIPLLIATQTGADGQPLPVAPTITGIVNLLAAESGLNLVLRPYPWRRAQMLGENGEGLLFGLAATPERMRTLNFSKPLYVVNQWLVAPAQSPLSFQHWEDLKGKVISVHSGGHYGEEFEEKRGKLFTVEDSASTLASRLKMMSIGRVDAVMIDSYRNARQFEVKLNCTYPDAGKITVMERPVETEPVLIAIAKSSRLNGVLPALNDAIERLAKAQTIQKMLEKKVAGASC